MRKELSPEAREKFYAFRRRVYEAMREIGESERNIAEARVGQLEREAEINERYIKK